METLRGGRLSLRLDALYCALVAASLLAFLNPLSRTLGLRPTATAALAAGAAAWAFALYRASSRPRLRRTLMVVLAANTAAATLIATFAAIRPWQGWFTILVAAVALEVAAFAVSQGFALRRR